jgi:UDP-N-acetylmuramoyl-L-alanyl-D-glutamate--2,6-diaminopimelate ligase
MSAAMPLSAPGLSLADLVVELGAVNARLASGAAVSVTDVRHDSRRVEPGDLFVARPGTKLDGARFAADAVARGAIALLAAEETPLPELGVPVVRVRDVRLALALAAEAVHGHPTRRLGVAGITGTNGKTTCAWLYAVSHGGDGAYMGTLGTGRPPALEATRHTTLDAVSVHRTLRALVDAGARHVAMEVSSHALDQGRVAGVRLPLAAFTNLTRDHLDYHGTMAAYGAAKARLFQSRAVKHAVINVGDAYGRRLAPGIELTRVAAAGTPPSGGRFVVATRTECRATGLELAGVTHAGPFHLRSPLLGAFNAENLLVVLGLLLAADRPLAEALAALGAAPPPPGRMETFELGARGPTLVVDYAHSPDALAKVLAALRAHTNGALWCVFGCGGDRDAGKRPLMAAAAEAGADRLVITDDNPRTEDPERIVAMITAALSGRVPAHIERDRAAAIRGAAAQARPGDVILVAGKGHEDYQIYGTEQRAYSDRAVARSLAEGAR